MAIVTETFDLSGRHMVRTFSDSGRYVIGGNPQGEYAEAVDPAEFGRTFVEGDLIPDEEAVEKDYQEALEQMGVEFNE